ncbi:hypothetical protein [Erythrobacter sp.]|uniref:head-tail connector protein n=1 Tax=Erythrobacter sp. TaxID=1042 RepID=UPI001425E4DA|nr:hypothetical protein [Erythrobacter sp.]QIQ87702.1 MAG: hypothetical protein G9473_14165 [Erythrobacter sp.]
MRRTVVQPASLAGDALAELKAWLGISRPTDDVMLVGLLEASHALCEAFTGQMPLAQLVEEEALFLPGTWRLGAEPVRSLASVERIATDATRSPLDSDDYEFTLEPAGAARIEFSARGDGGIVAIRFHAGMALEWADLPAPLRQGMVRLAAHYFRERDRPAQTKSEKPGIAAPASVTALWRPWRRPRLA